MGLGFYIRDFLFRKLLRNNADTPWAVHHTATVYSPAKIYRGRGVFPGDSPGVYINACNGVTIGDFTNIGPNVGLLSANHDLVDNSRHLPAPPIVIGRYCWLGMNATVLPGIVLGDFTIVGAGAVVTRSFPDGYCVVAGNPAAIIRTLDKSECEQFAAGR
jgi:acetyltransferase-like isoleucine patch superfamily enzyme